MYSFETKGDLFKFLKSHIINTAEACQILGCTRQNIVCLIKSGALVPIKTFPKDKIFLREDVLKRLDYKE